MERDQLHSSSTQFVHVSDLGVNESQDGLFSVSVLNTLTSLDKDALPPVRTFQSEANKPMSERVTRWEDASASLTSPELDNKLRLAVQSLASLRPDGLESIEAMNRCIAHIEAVSSKLSGGMTLAALDAELATAPRPQSDRFANLSTLSGTERQALTQYHAETMRSASSSISTTTSSSSSSSASASLLAEGGTQRSQRDPTS